LPAWPTRAAGIDVAGVDCITSRLDVRVIIATK
jgi:hypothetical protein